MFYFIEVTNFDLYPEEIQTCLLGETLELFKFQSDINSNIIFICNKWIDQPNTLFSIINSL